MARNSTMCFLEDGKPQSVLRRGNHAPRLMYSPQRPNRAEWSHEALASSIKHGVPDGTHVFLDTCFITSSDAKPPFVWDAILERDICIATEVAVELAPWLRNPHYATYFHGRIGGSVLAPPVKIIGRESLRWPFSGCVDDYVNLLWLRKCADTLLRDTFVAIEGRQPSESELEARMDYVLGDRGRALVKSDPKQRASVADESTVMIAILTAIMTGKGALIVTSDKDLLEQFYKAAYILDTHYTSHVLANHYKWNPTAFKTFAMPMERHRFQYKFRGNGNLVVAVHDRARKNALPAQFRGVTVSCLLVTGSSPLRMSFLSFEFEREMEDLFAARALTRSNTTLFGSRNAHRCFDPDDQDSTGGFMVIAEDVTRMMGWRNQSVVDIELSTFRRERFDHEVMSPFLV